MSRSRALLAVCFGVAIIAACATATVSNIPTCTASQKLCSGACVDLQTDSENCGVCATECATGQACVAGACAAACPEGNTMCGGDAGKASCVSVQSDNANCGACGKSCAAGEVCYGGQCSSACSNGTTKCGDASAYCANLKSDNQNCGVCGTPCGADTICTNGKCASTCDTDQTLCGGDGGAAYCANLQSDNANCGACGTPCTGTFQNCSGGTCSSECTAIQKLCAPDGGAPFCADTLTDNTNCGSCGHVCAAPNAVCSGGLCSGSKFNVLICGAPSTATWNTDIQTKLTATNAFTTVDVMACNTTTPTLVQLQAYGAVLVFSDTTFADAATLGNNLASYVSGNGYAVVATFANTTSIAIGGNWTSQGYNLLTLAAQEEPSVASALIIIDSSSPLVAGVSTLTATSAFRSTGTATNGGVVVAEWGDGKPLIIRGVKNGKNHAELNMYPPSSTVRSDFWAGDGATIMKNALLYR